MARKGSRKYNDITMQDIELGVAEDRQKLDVRHFCDDRSDDQHFSDAQERAKTVSYNEPLYKKTSTTEHVDKDITEVRPGVIHTLPRVWSRSSRMKRHNTQLLEAIEDCETKEVERLLRAGANPNATCRLAHVSACHLAALTGGDTLVLLLEYGAVDDKIDQYGRTPLHMAAWSGAVKEMCLLMNLPDGLLDVVEDVGMEEIKKNHIRSPEMVNVQCEVGVLMELPENWEDGMVHNCKHTIDHLPLMEVGWTPLHAASSNARPDCVHQLLAAGANPNIQDLSGRTPLDVAGSAYYQGHAISGDRFREVVETLLKTDGKYNSKLFQQLKQFDSPFHTAVELGSLDAIKNLLDAGAPVTCLNGDGQSPLHLCVKKRLRKHLQVLSNHNDADRISVTPTVDVRDKDGNTVLHAAVKCGWLPGVCVALEAGADVTSMANDGETPLHSAAAVGDLDILSQVLSVAKQDDVLDYKNKWDETALFVAVVNGQLACLHMILNAGALIKKTESANKHILHEAALRGHFDILQVLLNCDNHTVRYMFKYKQDLYLWSPEYFAIINNHVSCFNVLFSKHIEIRKLKKKSPYDASGLLITAAEYNRLEIANKIIDYNRMTIHARVEGITSFNVALSCNSRDVLKLLLENGISLSSCDDDLMLNGATIINSIMCLLNKPTEFLQKIFDESINKNVRDFQDPICRIIVSYRILITNGNTKQMKVLKALLETGNEQGQRKLLLHPVIESFLYLKWRALSSFFYAIVILIGLFVFSLNIFVISVFYYKDTGKQVPVFLHPVLWKHLVYTTGSLVAVLECMNIISKKRFSLSSFFKFTFIALAVAIPSIITAESLIDAEWPRHIATVALLNSWVEIMILLSQTPYWGYYVLMFRRVASKVVKILLTFLFVVIAFALSFTIQFHSKKPFEDPWAAFIKTIVMMTSEFDYKATFDENSAEEISASILIWRILFVVFIILTAIVLMNLMVGVAVTDLHNLVFKQQLKRLEDQIIFLDSLEELAHHKLLPRFLNRKRYVDGILRIVPSDPNTYKHIPMHIIQAIFNKIQAQEDLKIQSQPENKQQSR